MPLPLSKEYITSHLTLARGDLAVVFHAAEQQDTAKVVLLFVIPWYRPTLLQITGQILPSTGSNLP